MSPRSIPARDIAEDLLERTGLCLIGGDFDSFADCFLLPHLIETFEGRQIIDTREGLRAMFDAVRAYHTQMGVTALYRRCVEAQYTSDDSITSTHESRLLANGELIQPPFPVICVLKRVDGNWKILNGIYAVTKAEDHSTALLTSLPGEDDQGA